jgi:S-adenosylmethionine-diacylgycerolhomoserine-N-methlytransferase
MISEAGQKMDRIYRYQRHFYDATRQYYLLGRQTLVNGLAPADDHVVLEIGCGTAWNLVQAARRYPKVRFCGLDASAQMLATAERNIAKAGLQNHIRLVRADATSFSGAELFGRANFDRIFISYALSMIPAWVDVLDRAATQLTPGGSLHIVDFGAARGLPAPVRTAIHAWLHQFHVTPRENMETVLIALAQRRGLDRFYTEMHRGYAQYAALTRR